MSLYDSTHDLFRWRQKWNSFIEVMKNHVSSWFKVPLIDPCSPVPSQPFQVFCINDVQVIIDIEYNFVVVKPILAVRSLSFVLLCTLNFGFLNWAIFIFFCCNHGFKVDFSNWESKSDSTIIFPLLPFGFKDHALNTLKLNPFAKFVFVNPRPV